MTHLSLNVPTQCWSSTVRPRSTEATWRLDFKQCTTVSWDKKPLGFGICNKPGCGHWRCILSQKSGKKKSAGLWETHDNTAALIALIWAASSPAVWGINQVNSTCCSAAGVTLALGKCTSEAADLSWRDLTYVSMCVMDGGWHRQGLGKRSVSGSEAGFAVVCLCFAFWPMWRGGGGEASQDRTAYDADSAGVMRPHLMAIYKQLLWVRNAVKEKQLKQEALVWCLVCLLNKNCM